jgi:rifampicin phosphotransferase
LADHYPRPVSAAMAPFMDVWSRETTAFMRNVGMPIEQARMAAVNGLPYITFAMAGGSGRKPPPPWVMKLAMKVVPSLRRAERRLTAVLAERPWVEGIAQWYDVDRPNALARMRGLAEVDPDALDDHALAAHLRQVRSVVFEAAAHHIALHGFDSVPPGLFAAQAMELGMELPVVMGLLRGASPASTGNSPELDTLRAAVAGRRATTLDELADLGPEVAEALHEFLLVHGGRLIDGYDVDCATLAEAPSLVVALATATSDDAPATTIDDTADDFPERLRAAREGLPPDQRARFDAMRTELDQARTAYGVRDDNSGILIAWPVGLLRRAMLAAGRRLAGRGELSDPALAIEAAPDELAAALEGSALIDVAALVARDRRRRSLRAADAPRQLGPPEPPPPDNMPGSMGLFFTALTIFGIGAAPETAPLEGMGIGTEPYQGTARLVIGGGEGCDRFEPGDVLVAPMTSPSYNVLLAVAGAVVTEEGSAMSHAAIMARELGIAAVVGAPQATTLIRDGDLVTVDPVAGRVIEQTT